MVPLEWLRMIPDVIFILFGALPILAFALTAYTGLFRKDGVARR